MNDTTSPQDAAQSAKVRLTPSAIVRYLDQFVIGQEEAKKALAVVVYTHYKKLGYAQASGLGLGKSNVLLVGPTGTGKTLLCETMSRAINVPFVSADATSLAQSQYVNDEIQAILLRLIEKAGGDLGKAQRGIVFIDEIDKLKAREGEIRATSGENVQHALLKIMEGASVRLNDGRIVDTSHMLFICSGAFVGIEEIVADGHSYGFISMGENNSQKILDRLNARIKPTDLIKFGLIPEFTGRLPVVANTKALTMDLLVRIMTEPRNAIYHQFREVLNGEGVELVIEKRTFDDIATLAVEYKIGARSLRGIFEEMIAPVLYAIPDRPEVKKVVFKSLFADPELSVAQ
jgi:ATP-dependent Clp protease ATP-binding subunit ClpX